MTDATPATQPLPSTAQQPPTAADAAAFERLVQANRELEALKAPISHGIPAEGAVPPPDTPESLIPSKDGNKATSDYSGGDRGKPADAHPAVAQAMTAITAAHDDLQARFDALEKQVAALMTAKTTVAPAIVQPAVTAAPAPVSAPLPEPAADHPGVAPV